MCDSYTGCKTRTGTLKLGGSELTLSKKQRPCLTQHEMYITQESDKAGEGAKPGASDGSQVFAESVAEHSHETIHHTLIRCEFGTLERCGGP